MSRGTLAIQDLLPNVLKLAGAAGDAIMEIYLGGDLGEIRKPDDSPLTRADLAAHHILVDGLGQLAPDIPVLSEEAVAIPQAERGKWSRFWLVDPLDGTKEFIKRNGEFTVNIALIDHHVPVLGVVYAPALGVRYYATRGGGAFVQRQAAGEAIRARRLVEGEQIGVVASRSHADARTAALIERLGDHRCVSMGSSLKLCLVAEGVAHFYPRLGPTMEWDTAAAHAVVIEAGGTVCDLGGGELSYGKADLHNPEFFVCHAQDKQKLKELIRQVILEEQAGRQI